MAEELKLGLTVLSKDTFNKVVDTSFRTFAPATATTDTDTVEELFRIFNKVFYSIPIYGPSNSLEALILKSKELYIEPDQPSPQIQPLLDEIAELRQRLLDANQQILSLSSLTNG